MPDEFYHNGLADPPAEPASSGPSMLDQAQGGVRNWWNGLGDDMRNQAGLPQSELLRRFGVSALMAPMALPFGRGPAGMSARDSVMAKIIDRDVMMAPEGKYAYDRGVTGGKPVTWPDGITTQTIGSSGDLVSRPGTTSLSGAQMQRPMPSNDPAPLHPAPDQGPPLASIHNARFLRALTGEPPLRVEMPKNLPPDWAVIQGDKP